MEVLQVGPLGVNCFIIGCDATREGVVVDAGGDAAEIIAAIERLDLKIGQVINTHGHFDHVGANRAVVEHCGARLLIHEGDAAMLARASEVARSYGLQAESSPAPDSFLVDGAEIAVGQLRFRVLHTPGHSPGCCCLYLEKEKLLISGDTLFADSIGRTDLPGGSHEQLINSVRTKIFTQPDDVTVCPGHGPATTIGHEKQYNPYF